MMGLFDFRKKGKILDLSRNFNKETKTAENKSGLAESSEEKQESIDIEDVDEKKKRFAKRFAGLIEKFDDLSNKIYHMEQRIEVLEKKLRVNNFDGE